MGLIEEENTVFKNKKIVLSSIAIIFALVVSSIFVNYTLANSDSQASLSDANGSGSKSTSLTGLSNIDRSHHVYRYPDRTLHPDTHS